MTDYVQTAKKIGKLVKKKNEAYGDSFAQSGRILKIYYPDGVRVDQYDDFLAMIRIIDKQFRIATDKDAFGENPWQDIAGYSILKVAQQETQEQNNDNVKTDQKG